MVAVKEQATEHLRMAYRLQMRGNITEALIEYERAARLYPTAEGLTFWGWALSFTGDYVDAIQKCKRAIELDPEFGNPYNDIGAYEIELGNLTEAADYLFKALKVRRYATPHFPRYNLGQIREREGLWFEARDWYRQALELSPNYTLAKQAYYKMQGLLN